MPAGVPTVSGLPSILEAKGDGLRGSGVVREGGRAGLEDVEGA